MRSTIFRVVLLAGLLSTAAVVCVGQQATRVWVSGTGDDSLPCSRTAPCKTFQNAVTKAGIGGEVYCLDPGAYGQTVITKAITIDCRASYGNIAVNNPGQTAIVINAPGAMVKLRGLSLYGATVANNGVHVIAAAKVYVEDTVIDGFRGNGILFESPAGASLYVTRSSIRNMGSLGVFINPGGLGAPSNTLVSIYDSHILANTNVGISALNAEVAVSNCLIAGNGTGLTGSNNGIIRIYGNTISGNATGILVGPKGGQIISYQNNAISGNTAANGTPSSTQAQQ